MSNLFSQFRVESPNVAYTKEEIRASYLYHGAPRATVDNGTLVLHPSSVEYEFVTKAQVPKLGVMIVGWGGNNGTTLTGAVLANKEGLQWQKRSNTVTSNYYGSMTQSSTIRIGESNDGKDVFIPFSSILPTVHPNSIVFGGWDISSMNLGDAMVRADVFDADLQRQLHGKLTNMRPLAACFDPNFVAANQSARADNVIQGTKWEALQQLRNDIRTFRERNRLDKVIILWSANTERYAALLAGVNDTFENLVNAVKANHAEVSPSQIYAMAAIYEHATFINGSPQNTFVPGLVEMAQQMRSFIGGDDFKTGQTKIKSVLVDFLVSAGIKPIAITSYNHLGNNDGLNLSAPQQFRSKEISKSNVVDNMVESNRLLYKDGEHPNHTVVIKYVPAVGDSKRALDEYFSEIFMGGTNTIALHNTCEDSLLAAPVMLDLVILAELVERITFRRQGMSEFAPLSSILSLLSYLLKAPLVPAGTPVVNALFRQRAALENVFRACVGLQPENHMLLEQKTHHDLKHFGHEDEHKDEDEQRRVHPVSEKVKLL